MSDKKTDGIRMFKMIHGLRDGKIRSEFDIGWEEALEAAEGAVTELFGVDFDDAYPDGEPEKGCSDESCESCFKEFSLDELYDLVKQLLDKHPLDDFDSGWNNAVWNCLKTMTDFFGVDDGGEEAELCSGDGKEEEHNNVSHPRWYCDGGIETLDYILAKRLDFLLGQVVKYVSRAGKKDPAKELEDLQKAQFYLNRKIDQIGARE